MSVKLDRSDFNKVFDFASRYYLDPTKNTTGRTTFEPRGLGSILDAFTIGKLAEIAVAKEFHLANKSKDYILNFNLESSIVVGSQPDIIGIVEKGKVRNPKLFIEIKYTSEKDHWIGLTEEQFQTIKRSAKSSKQKDIFFVYVSIHSNSKKGNPKSKDLTGMYLNDIVDSKKSKVFQGFANLNATCEIDFILSSKDFEKYNYAFEKGMNMYDSNPINEVKQSTVFNKKGEFNKSSKLMKTYSGKTIYSMKLADGTEPEKKELSEFEVNGRFNVINKGKRTLIVCLSDVKASNKIFGQFNLKKGAIYTFDLNTLGRDPKLKRNNLFVSKSRINQLLEARLITDAKVKLNEIVKEI